MDPVTLSAGILSLNSVVATIVHVALDTKDGRKTLDSTLKELPILFCLLDEMCEGVLKAESSIPESVVRAFRACQTDLDTLIQRLTQRGLMGFRSGHDGFSGLKERLSKTNTPVYSEIEGEPIKKSRWTDRHSFKEKLHLLDFESLVQAVKAFKESVLLLRHIAMDFKTHHLPHLQAADQQAVLGELHMIRAEMEQSVNTNEENMTHQSELSGSIIDGLPRRPLDRHTSILKGLPPSGISRHSMGAVSTMSRISDPVLHLQEPSEYPRLQGEGFSTLFNVVVAIPHPSSTPDKVSLPTYICARTKLDTGSAKNLISEKMVSQYRLDYLKKKVNERVQLTLGDGKSTMSSEYVIDLTWYNTQDSMRSYLTKYYCLDVDHFDLLLGEEHYAGKDGVLKYKQGTFYFALYNMLKRSNGQMQKEKLARETAEQETKEKLQQERDAVAAANKSTVMAAATQQTDVQPNTTGKQSRSGDQGTVDGRDTSLSLVPEQSPEDPVMMTSALMSPLSKQFPEPTVQRDGTATISKSSLSKQTEKPPRQKRTTASPGLGKMSGAAEKEPSSNMGSASHANSSTTAGSILRNGEMDHVHYAPISDLVKDDRGVHLDIPLEIGRQKNAIPSLNASIHTIDGLDPETPVEEKSEGRCVLAERSIPSTANSADSVLDPKSSPSNDEMVGKARLKGIGTASGTDAPNVQTSVS